MCVYVSFYAYTVHILSWALYCTTNIAIFLINYWRLKIIQLIDCRKLKIQLIDCCTAAINNSI